MFVWDIWMELSILASGNIGSGYWLKVSKQNIGPNHMEALNDDVYYVTLVQ